MSVTAEIVASWRAPRRVIRDRLAGPVREDRALMFLFLACLLIFVAQWPRLAREAALAENGDLMLLVGGALMGWLFIAPLAFYGLAALSRLAAALFGGRGTWYSARMALFWSLLAASPLWLLHGLVAGFMGPGPALDAAGLLLALGLAGLWAAALWETEWAGPAPHERNG